MKLGILGTGKIVQELLKGYDRLGVEKTYLFSTPRSREKAENMAREHGFAGVFTDYDALLAADIDAVYVALPNDLHYAFTEKALQAGKHVILEKPATSRLCELEALFALAHRQGRMLIEAVTVHQLPAFAALREALGSIGTVRLASFSFCQYSSRYTDFLRGNIHPVFDPQKSGGALYDLNVYNIHAALGLFGVPESVRYEANVQRGIDTSGVLTLDYGTHKAVCIAAKDCDGPNISTVHGESGVLTVDAPMSRITGLGLRRNGQPEIWQRWEEDDRVLTEFSRLIPILESGNRAEAARLEKLSLAAADILEQARLQAGIRFACDPVK